MSERQTMRTGWGAMITSPPKRYRRRAGRIAPKANQPSPPVGPLALVAAVKETVEGQLAVRMVFNQPIDVGDFVPGTLVLVDGVTTHAEYGGAEVLEQPTPASVIVTVGEGEPTEAENVTLTVSQPTGIVAVDDGEEWEGVENLGLPFGE